MMKRILCHFCKKPIKNKEDLITAFHYLLAGARIGFVEPFHASCYARNLKSVESLFLSNYPVNGIAGNFAAFLVPFFGTMLLAAVISQKYARFNIFLILLFMIIFSIPIFIRLYSYYVFEKPLERQRSKTFK